VTGPLAGPATSQMRADIADIPAVVDRLVAHEASAVAEVADAMRRYEPAWASIVARGSSDHVAVYTQYLLEAYLGLPTGLALPSVTTVYESPIAWRGGLVLAISQSGESPDVWRVIEAARAGGAPTVAITNEPGSPLATAAEYVLDCHAGAERAIPATKTYVGCLAVASRLVAELRPASDLARALPRLGETLVNVIEQSDAWLRDGPGGELVGELAAAERALMVSRGYNLATALEVALKLKEACGRFAAGYSSADVMHGPMVLAMPDVPMVVFRPDGPMGPAIDEATAAAASRGVQAWAIGGAGLPRGERSLGLAPHLPESLTPLAYVLPGHLLTDRLAARLGVSPDAPTGLAKVTRTT
jgi:glucosamine--fructose-6-phosphate aminotransferase (isomerizing)